MLNFCKKMLGEFREFAIKGNAFDMAVGIIIGAAFGKIVDSMVKDVVMPPLGWMMGKVDFTNLYLTLPNSEGKIEHFASLEAAKAAGAVTINYGVFINTLISFVIVAFSVFLLVKVINKLKTAAFKEEQEAAPAEPTTKTCPKCFSEINIHATRCPHCTSDL